MKEVSRMPDLAAVGVYRVITFGSSVDVEAEQVRAGEF